MTPKRFLVCLLFLLAALGCYSQRSYALRLNLSELDTSARIACYDLQIANTGTESWYLGNSNIFIFYDYSIGCFIPDSSGILLDELIYDVNNLALNAQKNENTGLPLPYGNTLGSIRIGFNANDNGLLLDSLGTWYSIMRLCFTLEVDDITSSSTCFQANFVDDEILMFLPVVDIVEAYNEDPTMTVGVPRDTAYNIIPDATLNSCFILEENTPELCNDGIDNDEDGLVDCEDDSACSPDNPSFNVNQPGGCDDRPSLIRVNDIVGDAMYSIDNGDSFQESNEFLNLPAGDYTVLIMKNGVMSCSEGFPIRLEQEECRENTDELCSDGVDNDEDGLMDCMDSDCVALIEEIIVVAPISCPDFSDGSIIVGLDPTRYQISGDGGASYESGTTLSGLTAGSYELSVINILSGCESFFGENPITIENGATCPPEAGFCDDGLDNDFDGLIDCADEDCIGDVTCEDPALYYLPNAINPFSTLNNGLFGVYPENGRAVIISSFQIYDRWGNLVHDRENTSSLDMNHFWNGTYQNQAVQPGVFLYNLVIIQRGRSIQQNGSLTVVY